MPDTPKILNTEFHLAEGVAFLSTREPAFARAATVTGPLRLRRRTPGFPALLSAIVSQQVSVATADAVWRRLDAAGLVTPVSVAQGGAGALRDCGLSRQKIRYALALAQSGIDFSGLDRLDDADLVAELTSVPGIGLWTAEIYAMFALGRADIFAAGDLALRESARLVFELRERPAEKALRSMAREWAPWRSVAATLLWQYYGAVKQRQGIRT